MVFQRFSSVLFVSCFGIGLFAGCANKSSSSSGNGKLVVQASNANDFAGGCTLVNLIYTDKIQSSQCIAQDNFTSGAGIEVAGTCVVVQTNITAPNADPSVADSWASVPVMVDCSSGALIASTDLTANALPQPSGFTVGDVILVQTTCYVYGSVRAKNTTTYTLEDAGTCPV